MKFTRNNLFESIFFILESNEIETTNNLYEIVKNNTIDIEDNETFKFQFYLSIKTILESERYKLEISTKDFLNKDFFDLKKLLVDIKDNKNIYEKFDRNLLFTILIEYL